MEGSHKLPCISHKLTIGPNNQHEAMMVVVIVLTMSDVLRRLRFDVACDRHGYHIILAEGRKN